MTSLFGEKSEFLSKNVHPSADANAMKNNKKINVTSSSSVSDVQDIKSSTVEINNFADMKLCDWICQSTSMMGFRRPTPIQAACIPAILQGRDVMGCAETGSGKTAAFALPILQTLSQDPYGIYCVVLTPTRELAMQISEQFLALGAPIGTRVCLIIGGLNMTEQSLQLSKKPHIVIATPGRLRAHLMSSDPPSLFKAKYIVLDEADRLLSAGFESELRIILENMSENRQTLLFSATLTSSLAQLETMAMKDTLRFDLTKIQTIPLQLSQKYLFLPAQVKLSYLYALLLKYILNDISSQENEQDITTNSKNNKNNGNSTNYKKHSTKKKRIEKAVTSFQDTHSSSQISFSIIIFVNTCKNCQEISETLTQLNINNVSLHSMMTQSNRLASLSKFRNQKSRILICTDVASRGLDISNVDMVINYDLPKITSDYIHRVGRTARAGKKGTSITFVTQYDVELVQTIEDSTGIQMTLCDDISDEDVVKVLNVVAKGNRMAELKLLENGFDEKVELVQERKRKQTKKLLRKVKARIETNEDSI